MQKPTMTKTSQQLSIIVGAGIIAPRGLCAVGPDAATGRPAGTRRSNRWTASRAGRGAGRGGRGRGNPRKCSPADRRPTIRYANYDFSKKAPVPPLPPAEELKKFILQPGYRLELVLSDPDIQEPTAIAFDGNGRMFVLEDRGYMQDADATGELDPIGRISLHVDTNNDGVYDKHTVFVDKLDLPAIRRCRSARTRS